MLLGACVPTTVCALSGAMSTQTASPVREPVGQGLDLVAVSGAPSNSSVLIRP